MFSKFSLTLMVSSALTPMVLAQAPAAAFEKDVAANYSNIAYHGYAEAHLAAKDLQASLLRLITAPNHLAHIDARISWIEARPPYMQTEVFRFYGGPIDKLETSVNGAADPVAIDKFIAGAEAITSGSISMVPGGTGYHAIEYLLWGEDTAIDGPGRRTYVDYTSEVPNATRRGQYLRAAGELLVGHLQILVDHWRPGVEGNFRSQLESANRVAVLQRLFTGAVRLAESEIAGNRIGLPLKSRKGEDEHSPFSDTTHVDILHSTAGIANVLAGAYVGIDGKIKTQGTGPIALAEKADAAMAAKLKAATNLALQAARGVGKPIDQALLAPEDSAERKKLTDCAAALAALAAEISKTAAALGVPMK